MYTHGYFNEKQRGITLIALVITIIVLLILAGVSIAMLTGENGILEQANTAKIQTDEKGALEAVQLEAAGAFDDNGKYDKDIAIKNLKENLKIPAEDITYNNEDGTLTVKYKGYEFNIDVNGKVTLVDKSEEGNNTKKVSEVTGSYADKNTTVVDDYNNTFILPEGFKVRVDDTTNNVTTVDKGIVIEDKNNNQFVWIPVGNIKTSKEDTVGTQIELQRCVFNEDGTRTTNMSWQQNMGSSSYTYTYQEPRNITINGGYYIGRYEARTKSKRTKKEDEVVPMTENVNDYVYNYITKEDAITLCKEMYEEKPYESDLINSYVWDTAMIFFQEFGGNKEYAIKTSVNSSFLENGTTEDKICNVYDMASNCTEWTTEVSGWGSVPCISRGGINSFAGARLKRPTATQASASITETLSFRPVIYITQ